jgi:hypothetical protein
MAERPIIGFTLGSTRDGEAGVPWRWKRLPMMRRHVVLIASDEVDEDADVAWTEERVACMACGHPWVCVCPVTVDLGRLECPICHEQASRVRGAYDG